MTRAQELIDDLKRPWRHGEHVDARGIVLGEQLVLDGLEIRGVDLSKATLRGGISAKGTVFRGLAWLRDTKILGECNFAGAHFRTDLRADNIEAEAVLLQDCVLQGVLSLAGSQLQALHMENALVMANLTLEKATISGVVDLNSAEIMGGVWTAEARLGSLKRSNADLSGRVQLPV